MFLQNGAADEAADAFPGSGAADKTGKISAHIAALQALYVIEPLGGWDAPVRAKSRVRTKPKRLFADPSLAASLLQISPERLLEDGQLFGLLFESLCLHDLAVYAQALPGAPAEPLRYYRDSDGLEVDAVIELRDGRWAAFEVKLGESKIPEAIRALNRLRAKVAANPAARNPKPAFAAVLVGAGESARHDAANDMHIIPSPPWARNGPVRKRRPGLHRQGPRPTLGFRRRIAWPRRATPPPLSPWRRGFYVVMALPERAGGFVDASAAMLEMKAKNHEN